MSSALVEKHKITESSIFLTFVEKHKFTDSSIFVILVGKHKFADTSVFVVLVEKQNYTPQYLLFWWKNTKLKIPSIIISLVERKQIYKTFYIYCFSEKNKKLQILQ